MYLFIFFSSNNLKQLSTFHPPLPGEMRMYSQKAPNYGPYLPELRSIRITYWFRHFHRVKSWESVWICRITSRCFFIPSCLQRQLFYINAPIFINAPRPWACRGMPFDDAYQDMFERVSLGAQLRPATQLFEGGVGPPART